MRPSGVLWQVLLESWLILTVGLAFGLAGGLLAIWGLKDGIDLGNWYDGLEMFGITEYSCLGCSSRTCSRSAQSCSAWGSSGASIPHAGRRDRPLKALNRQQE